MTAGRIFRGGNIWRGMIGFFNGTLETTKSMSAKKDQRIRSAALSRDTNETKIVLAINLDGGAFPDHTDGKLTKDGDGHATQVSKSQVISINSGIGFLDHMLHALAKHAGWSLALICKGDLHSENSQVLQKIDDETC